MYFHDAQNVSMEFLVYFDTMHFVFFMFPMNHSGNNTKTIGEGRSR
jgi:hypothetical protein